MLGRQCQLFDIEDVEAFVMMCIRRSGIKPDPTEFDDLVAEGICILWQMSQKYQHHRAGYDKPGRFSGYAVKYMPRKMKEAYHRSHEHHLHRTQADGTRKWEFMEAPTSWDKLTAHTDDHHLDETRIRTVGNFIEVPQH